MTLKSLIEENPLILTLLPTHKCTASCHNCCFGCNPKIEYRMSYEEMVYNIDQALKSFPTIHVLVITGGECFTLGEDLDRIINYGAQQNLVSRVVTNAYWADTYDNAYNRLSKLKQSGLSEFNMSTGKSHQEFVNQQNIINAAIAAVKLGFAPIQIAYEIFPDSTEKNEKWKEDEAISELISEKKVEIISGPWMAFKNDFPNNPQYRVITSDVNKRCHNIYRSITINPYSELLACCGLTAEYNPYLKLGNLREKTLQELYDNQFEDLYILWLYTHGPKYIYDLLLKERGCEGKTFPHPCAYCIEIIKAEENITVLKNIIRSYIPSILYRLKMINKKMEV